MNILLLLYNLIYGAIKAIINIRYFHLKIIRNRILDKYFNEESSIANIFSLLLKIIILSIYEFCVFHIYIFIYLINDSSIDIKFFGIILRFLIIFSISCVLALIVNELSENFEYLIQLIISLSHLILWIIALIFFLVTFDKELLDIILFKKKINGFLEILTLFGSIFINFFEQVLRYVLILAHLLHILSIIRLIEICRNNKEKIPTYLLIKSFGFILYDIFILTPAYISIILIPPVFISSNITILSKCCKNNYSYLNLDENGDGDIKLFPKYYMIKYQIINDSKKMLIYYIALIFTILSIPFIWRIHITLSLLFKLFKTKDIKQFLIDYYNNFIDCVLPIISFIPLIIVHLSPIHLKALCECYYQNKNWKNSRKYFFVVLRIFYEKLLDILVFIISLFRLVTFNFYIYLIRKKCKLDFLFILLNNEYIKINNTNKENRYKILKITLIDIIISFVIVLQILLGILNPFYALKIINNILLYFISCKNHTLINFKDIETLFLLKSIKKIILLFFLNLIYLPISLILNIIAPWTIKYNFNLLISNNKKAFNKIKNYERYSIEFIDKEKDNEIKLSNACNKYCDKLITIFKSMIEGYILIFQFIIIHITLFRSFVFWYKLIKKINNYTVKDLAKEQFNYIIMEFIYIPFLLIIIILEPWNFEIMKQFFNADNCLGKFDKFKELIIIFVNDILLVIILILLMITLIDTIPTILLIIRSIKLKFNPSEENNIRYNLNYKTNNFKTELRTIYNKNIKKITTTFLFVLNILLITRIKYLFVGTFPFFVLFFKKCYRNLIKCFSPNGKRKPKNDKDKLTKMPYIIVSEICSFLDVKDINRLSRANKNINEKTNINYIWENIFYKRCDKKLKQVLKDEDYSSFSHNKFETFKETCKNCYYIILAKKGKILGPIKTFTDIVEEEAIKSIFNIPFILLIPRIIFCYCLKKINTALAYININLNNFFGLRNIIEEDDWSLNITKEQIESEFFVADIIEMVFFIRRMLLISYSLFLILNLPLFYLNYYINKLLFIIYKILDYDLIQELNENKLNDFYSSFDYLLLKNLFSIIIIIAQIIIISYVLYIKIIIILIKCISLDFNKLQSIETIETKIKHNSLIMILLNFFYGIIYLIIKYSLFILHSLYYIFIDLNIKYNSSPYYIIKNLSDVIYNSNFFVFIQIFLGKFCLNIPCFFLNVLGIKHILCYLSDTTEIIFVDILSDVFKEYKDEWFYANLFPIKYILMYIAMLFNCIYKKTSIKFSIILNIISLILGLLPFYLLYPCYDKNTKRNLFFGIPLIAYAIANLFICGNVMKNI